MYSSSTSFNPFQYTTITNSLTDIQNPNPIQQFPSSPFLQFPAPFLDDNGDLLLSELLNIQHQHHPQLQQNQHQQILGSDSSLEEETHNQKMNPEVSRNAARINNKKKKSSMNGTKQQIPRKRSGKKDRHSKIYTAHGPRDRRMRLSLQIARKFFDLQDMLGFDKASKTIDWLFTKSKAAIKELTDNLTKTERSNSGGCSKTVSSTSESEVMSGLKLTAHMNGDRRCMAAAVDDSILSIPKQKSCKKSDNKPIFNPLARESRNKARARARERTKEKLKIKGLDKSKTCSHPNPNNLEHLGPSGSVENGEFLRFENQKMKSSPVKMVGEEEKQDEEEEEKEEEEEEEEEAAASSLLLPHQMDSISIVDNFLGLTGTTKSSSIFDLSHQDLVVASGADIEDEFPGFRGNWDISHGRVYNRYSAIPNSKISTTGNVHVQNPNAIFMTNPNSPQQKTSSNFEAQDQNLASVFMATLDPYQQNPRSLLMNFSYSNQQNPTPLPMATVTTALHSHFTENHFSCNPNPPIKYDSLY